MPTKFALILCLLASSAVMQPATAADDTEDRPVFTGLDMHAIFDQRGDAMQLMTLSQNEMKETEGAFNGPGAVHGGMGGGLGYAFSSYIGNEPWSWYNFATSVGGGALAGGTLGAAGAVWTFNSSVAKGIADGVATQNGW